MNKYSHFKRALPLAAALAALTLSALQTASAKSLVFNATPVSDAVAQINHELGIHIALKSGVDPNTLVSFSINDLSSSGAQLDAVNNLANALNADYQKTYVVSKVIADSAVVVPRIDTNAPVVFRHTTLAAQDAIDLVAAVDNAQVRYYTPITGDVTMSAATLSATQAAQEIAEQTHTQWKAYYGITRRTRDRTDGTVIGYTAGGRPIIQLPLLSFREPAPPPPAPQATASASTDKNANANANNSAPLTPAQQAAAYSNGVFPYPNGYDQYGYPTGNPYGNGNPYYNNPYGYNPNPGATVFGSNGYPSANGYSSTGNIIYPTTNPYGFGGGPIIIGP